MVSKHGKPSCWPRGWGQGFPGVLRGCCGCPGSRPYLVTLKILSRRRALSTLMPKEVPGFTAAQITSKMLPTMTCRERELQRGLSSPGLPPERLRRAQESELGLNWKTSSQLSPCPGGEHPGFIHTQELVAFFSSNQTTLKYLFFFEGHCNF